MRLNNQRSLHCTALVINRVAFAEKDFMVTLLSQEFGKHTVVAKGANSLTSSRLAGIEPGTLITAHLVKTRQFPLLTQVRIQDQLNLDPDIGHIRAVTQWLEVLNILFVEEELPMEVFSLVLHGQKLMSSSQTSLEVFRTHLKKLIDTLGFTDENSYDNQSISNIIESIADKPLKGYNYLTIK